ncbi:hypothetical protein CkaCkLH20_05944 [Colletotrichum karsti]|uniref:DUF4440 domain-containing protein n=1 Tax=Colletotrichum karsti TaxID=1095194 RepID=A0A9P6I7I5_9PEZI|nr:uncharacterized protein CkaCkLH20_05944 [Colletotrichum karsti]KAF9876536.1 hypothetical protein CkaCkLH20_05944 [Colletotrichum karsti]
MPSVLGLTKDPSPHGPGAEEREKKKKPQLQGGQDTSDKQLAHRERKPSSSQSPPRDDKQKKPKKEKKEKKEKPKPKRREYDTDDESEDEGPLNTIAKRNHAKAIEMETLLWGALCHKPKSALKYIGKGAIMCNPLLFGDPEVYSEKSEPTLKEVLKDCDRYLSYKMHKPHTVEIGLMAMAICYDITLFRQADDGTLESEEATVSTSWRQCASGDWEMTSSMAGWQD